MKCHLHPLSQLVLRCSLEGRRCCAPVTAVLRIPQWAAWSTYLMRELVFFGPSTPKAFDASNLVERRRFDMLDGLLCADDSCRNGRPASGLQQYVQHCLSKQWTTALLRGALRCICVGVSRTTAWRSRGGVDGGEVEGGGVAACSNVGCRRIPRT